MAANVIRCIDSLYTSYGINVITDVLKGSYTEKIESGHLDKSEFFGIESGASKQMIKQVINYMLVRGYIRQSEDRFGVLSVDHSNDVSEILMNRTVLKMRYREKGGTSLKKSAKSLFDGEQTNRYDNNEELYKALAKQRMKLAKVKSVPAYVIFTDKTLKEMCIKRPLTEESMLAVSGVGESKLKKYGKGFIEIIKKYS